LEEGRERFVGLVREIDGDIHVVIPVAPTQGRFLISLTKGGNRKFMTVHEDDILDLPIEPGTLAKISQAVRDVLQEL
jgi:hypothetical protein